MIVGVAVECHHELLVAAVAVTVRVAIFPATVTGAKDEER
jgi:hypothetical protein